MLHGCLGGGFTGHRLHSLPDTPQQQRGWYPMPNGLGGGGGGAGRTTLSPGLYGGGVGAFIPMIIFLPMSAIGLV